MKQNLSLVLAALVAAMHFPAAAQTVEVAETPPAVETAYRVEKLPFTFPAEDGAAYSPIYHVTRVGGERSADEAAAAADAAPAIPIALSAGTGQDTRLAVDLAAADKATEGWPWYGKAAVVVGCVLVAGLATWAIIDACQESSHDNDSSTHTTIWVSGEGNATTITVGSPSNTGDGSYR